MAPQPQTPTPVRKIVSLIQKRLNTELKSVNKQAKIILAAVVVRKVKPRHSMLSQPAASFM